MYKHTTAITAALLAAGIAIAADAPEFTMIDKDKNGYVSREEARSAPDILELFAQVDANRDGQLSTAEYSEAVRQLQG
jgi:Ca2+-binding EF-hand superfamily protein